MPLSPSRPFSTPPLTYQTTASVLPSVVVTMGEVSPPTAPHQATTGLMAPATTGTETAITTVPLAPPAGQPRAPCVLIKT